MQQGATLVSGALAGLDDAAFTSPTELAGWTRAHVVAHLSANAEAVGRLVHWAATGEPTPMYSSMEQRNADIESGSRLAGLELTEWFNRSAATLDDAMANLTDRAVGGGGRHRAGTDRAGVRDAVDARARGDGARGRPRDGHRIRRPARGLPDRPVRRHRRQANCSGRLRCGRSGPGHRGHGHGRPLDDRRHRRAPSPSWAPSAPSPPTSPVAAPTASPLPTAARPALPAWL